jgi:UDP-N-acetylglucosamine acyltransferase
LRESALMSSIDATARIEPGATIGRKVSIGPYCVIGSRVVIGDGCRLVAHVHITGHTTIGPQTAIYPFASLGTPPQSVKYRGGPTRLIVGADCDIRESVTMNTGTEDDRGVTEVGDRCLLMVGSHIGHDCKVGSDVTFANNVVLGGHVNVGDFVVFGGQAAVRQFVRIGQGAMVVGLSGVRADVIPFGLVQGPLAQLIGLNVVGMRRRGWKKADIHRLRRAYEFIFFGAGIFRERVEQVAAQDPDHPLIREVTEFIRSGSHPLTTATRRGQIEQPT